MLRCHASQLCAAVRRVQVPCFHGGEGEIWSARFPATAHVALLGGREMSDPPNRVHDLTDGTATPGRVTCQCSISGWPSTPRTTVATTARSDQDDCFSASLLQYRKHTARRHATDGGNRIHAFPALLVATDSRHRPRANSVICGDPSVFQNLWVNVQCPPIDCQCTANQLANQFRRPAKKDGFSRSQAFPDPRSSIDIPAATRRDWHCTGCCQSLVGAQLHLVQTSRVGSRAW
jgi:hypothetical protein